MPEALPIGAVTLRQGEAIAEESLSLRPLPRQPGKIKGKIQPDAERPVLVHPFVEQVAEAAIFRVTQETFRVVCVVERTAEKIVSTLETPPIHRSSRRIRREG